MGNGGRSTRPDKESNVLSKVRKHLDAKTYIDTIHAEERKDERNITLQEMIEVLRNGHHEKKKDQFDEFYQDWKYAIRGKTDGEQRSLRIIVAFDEESGMLIITAIDLEVD